MDKFKPCLHSHLASCCVKSPWSSLYRFQKVTEIATSDSCCGRGFQMRLSDPTSTSFDAYWRLQAAATEPAGREWLTWHCSLDSCCDCQHMKSRAVFSFFPPRFLTQVAFDSSKPESADGLSSRVSVCTSQQSSCWEGCKMLNRASVDMECMFIPSELYIKDAVLVTMCDKST